MILFAVAVDEIGVLSLLTDLSQVTLLNLSVLSFELQAGCLEPLLPLFLTLKIAEASLSTLELHSHTSKPRIQLRVVASQNGIFLTPTLIVHLVYLLL